VRESRKLIARRLPVLLPLRRLGAVPEFLPVARPVRRAGRSKDSRKQNFPEAAVVLGRLPVRLAVKLIARSRKQEPYLPVPRSSGGFRLK